MIFAQLPIEVAYERWQAGWITKAEYDAIRDAEEAARTAMRDRTARRTAR